MAKPNPFEGRPAPEIKTEMLHAATELRTLASGIHAGARAESRDKRIQAIKYVDTIRFGVQELGKRGDRLTFKPREIPSAFKEHFEGTPLFGEKPESNKQKPESKFKRFMKRITRR